MSWQGAKRIAMSFNTFASSTCDTCPVAARPMLIQSTFLLLAQSNPTLEPSSLSSNTWDAARKTAATLKLYGVERNDGGLFGRAAQASTQQHQSSAGGTNGGHFRLRGRQWERPGIASRPLHQPSTATILCAVFHMTPEFLTRCQLLIFRPRNIHPAHLQVPH